MKKNVFGRKFKRDKNERKALFSGLISSLILNERIETTEQKAKAIKADIDKLITRAKKNALNQNEGLSNNVLKKLTGDIAPRFSQRAGGYTRIIRLGKRFGDDATMVILEWVELASAVPAVIEKTVKAKEKKPVKKAPVKKTAKKTTAKIKKTK